MLQGSPSVSRHTAFAAALNNRWLLVVDGVEGKPYDRMAVETLAWSPGRWLLRRRREHARGGFRSWLDAGVRRPPVHYTGRLYAYAAKRDGKWFAKLYGKNGAVMDPEGKPYELASKPYDMVGDFTFSPDSRHMAYGIKRGDKWVIITDGVEGGKEYDSLMVRSLCFQSRQPPPGLRPTVWRPAPKPS